MKEFFEQIYSRLTSGEDLMLVTIIAGSGSTPRGAGAKMAICKDGSSYGTIGGGAVEYQSQQMAAEALRKKRSFLHNFCLAPNQVADLGMICGGDVTVYFQYLTPAQSGVAELFQDLIARCGQDSNSWLVTSIQDENNWLMLTLDSDGRVVSSGDTGNLNPMLKKELMRGKCVLHQVGNVIWYSQPVVRSGMVYIFGGGHITQQLVPMLDKVFFNTTVIDSNELFANASLYPLAKRIVLSDFDKVFSQITPDEGSYIIIVTRGHQHDYEVLIGALRTPACYIGMIGSRSKIAATYTKLIANDGFGYADVERVNAPIGLPIGGETPEEIAVSITAQLIQVRSGRDGR